MEALAAPWALLLEVKSPLVSFAWEVHACLPLASSCGDFWDSLLAQATTDQLDPTAL